MVDKLDFNNYCDDDFVEMLPNLKIAESSGKLRSKIKLRTVNEVLVAWDLAYCLHWAIREAQVKGIDIPGRVTTHVVIERRRALQWLIGQEPWDEVPMDW